MALVRSFTRPSYSSHNEIVRLFDSLFDSATPFGSSLIPQRRLVPARFVPALDVVEEGDELVVRADLPGLRQEDVKVEILDNVLTISGERRLEHDDSGDGYRRIERSSGSFTRSLSLPRGVDPTAVKARFADGVLEVRTPKPAQAKPQAVEIEVGA